MWKDFNNTNLNKPVMCKAADFEEMRPAMSQMFVFSK